MIKRGISDSHARLFLNSTFVHIAISIYCQTMHLIKTHETIGIPISLLQNISHYAVLTDSQCCASHSKLFLTSVKLFTKSIGHTRNGLDASFPHFIAGCHHIMKAGGTTKPYSRGSKMKSKCIKELLLKIVHRKHIFETF